MPPTLLPADASGQLDLLHEMRILDSGPEPALDAVTRLLHLQSGRPIVLLCLIDADRVWVKSAVGWPTGPMARDAVLCEILLGRASPVEVQNACLDDRLAAHPLVHGAPQLRTLASVALVVEGQQVGALCAFGHEPGALTASGRAALVELGTVSAELLHGRLRERRLRRQAARVRSASLSSSDWLWETDHEGRVTWVSDSIEGHTGRPASADIGLTMAQINRRSPVDLTGSWDRFLDARSRLQPFKDLITDRPTPKGVVVTRISGAPVFDSQGVFRGYRGATSNITEQLRAQDTAREAEQLLSDALDALVAGVMISDPHGRVIRSNAAWRAILDEASHPDSLNWPDMVRAMTLRGDYPDAVGQEEAFIRWRLSIVSSLGAQHELRWRDRWHIVSARRLPSGNVVHLSIDITDRKQAELALAARESELRESRQRLAAVLQAVPDLWFVIDAQGCFLECSTPEHPSLVRAWDDLRGQRFGSGMSPARAEAGMAAIRRALETGELQRHEYPLRTRDGASRWFEARVSPMPDGRVLYVSRDLTELRSLERDLVLMKRAVEADAALPMCVCDARQPDLPIIYANPALETLSGYSRAELLGRNCRLLQGHLKDQPGIEVLRRAIAAGRECSVVLENVRRDGTVFTNALHIAPVMDGAGALTHYIGVLHDVTGQTRAAEKLRLSEALYRSVAAAISDGLVVVTPTLTVIAINAAACAVLGVEDTAIVGSTRPWPFEFLAADGGHLAHEAHPVRRIVRGGSPLSREVHALLRPDGQRRWIELNAHPLQMGHLGTPPSIVLTFRDITQQRSAEQALVAAEERWHFALEGSGDGVWDWDTEAGAVYYSPRWKRMLGHDDNEVAGTLDAWRTRVHPDDLPRVMADLQRHLRGETPVYQSEHRMRHRDGSLLWVLDRGKVVSRGPGGQPLRVVGTQSDVTGARQAEQALRDKQAAELASAAKSQFLSRMSHEMRTPLNAVIGFAQLMRMTQGGGPGTELGAYAEHVLDAGEHLLALINDVLDLQKVEEGAMTLALGPVALDDIVLRTLELLQPAASARDVGFDTRLAPGTWVRADPQRLRQIVLNIASNAIKYNHPGGTVRVTVEPPTQSHVMIVIEDNGPGMTSGQMARLFQPFERLGRETSNIEGTGLGLIIARSLARAIGGRLEVSSTAGEGTRVSIELQRAEAPDTPKHHLTSMAASDDTPLSAQLPLRMLYVEDNRINAILFEGALRMHNSNVELRVAEDGEEAIALAREWAPEVLVLDAHLPGMSGFDVLQQLRQLPGLDTAPAYMCSADAMPEDVQRAYEAGFIGYWTKPIDISAMLNDIDRIAGHVRGTPPRA